MPSGSRGAVFTTPGSPFGQRYAIASTPRGSRPSCRATASRSAGSTTGYRARRGVGRGRRHTGTTGHARDTGGAGRRRRTVRRVGDGVPQRRVPGLAAGHRLRGLPGTASGPTGVGSCTWYGMSPGITKPRRSRACAAMNTGSASLTFCCSRSAICERNWASASSSCFISARWEKYVRTGPAMVSVSTHTTAARIAARRAAEPNRCSDCCSAASAIDWRTGTTTVSSSSTDSSSTSGVTARGSAGLGSRRTGDAPRGLPLAVSPDLPPLPGRDAGERRLGSGRFASGMVKSYLLSSPKRGKARSPA